MVDLPEVVSWVVSVVPMLTVLALSSGSGMVQLDSCVRWL